MSIHRLVILQTMYGRKKIFSTFSYKLVQISPIMILVNSGAFLSISSWFCELTELIFVMILFISSTGYPPKTQEIMGHVQVANTLERHIILVSVFCGSNQGWVGGNLQYKIDGVAPRTF